MSRWKNHHRSRSLLLAASSSQWQEDININKHKNRNYPDQNKHSTNRSINVSGSTTITRRRTQIATRRRRRTTLRRRVTAVRSIMLASASVASIALHRCHSLSLSTVSLKMSWPLAPVSFVRGSTRTINFVSSSSSSSSSRHLCSSFLPSPSFSCSRIISSSISRNMSSSSSSSSSSFPFEDAILLSSTKSTTVKRFQSLSSSKKRRMEQKATLLEGHRLVIDTLSNPSLRPLYQHVLVTREALYENGPLGDALLNCLRQLNGNDNDDDGEEEGRTGCRIDLATNQVVQAACDTVTPQGVVAIVQIPPPYSPPPIKTNTRSPTKTKFYLILDGLSDPGNVGTLLRSSLAVGVEAVILLSGGCDPWNPKTVRSSMGAALSIPLLSLRDWNECRQFLLDQCGMRADASDVFAASMEGSADGVVSSCAHYEVDWARVGGDHHNHDGAGSKRLGGVALCIGKEGAGLGKQVREAVARGEIRSVHVPMEDGIESLNAAVCGSVIMFEYLRQCRVALSSSSSSSLASTLVTPSSSSTTPSSD